MTETTAKLLREINYAPGDLAKKLAAVKPAYQCDSAARKRVLARIHGMRLPWISNVLTFANELRHLGAVDHKIAIALLRGECAHVVLEDGPISAGVIAAGYGEQRHYQIRARIAVTEGESVEITHEGETYTATVREGGRVSIARGEAWSGDGTLLATAGRVCIVDCTADLPESVYDALGAALTNGGPEA